VGAAANVADVIQVNKLLHGEESAVSADAGYTGAEKRTEHASRKVIWQIATRCGCYQKLGNKVLCINSSQKASNLRQVQLLTISWHSC